MTPSSDPPIHVTAGADTHRDTHMIAALDQRGGELGVREFATDPTVHDDILDWLESFGTIDRIGVEGTGTYGAGLCLAIHFGIGGELTMDWTFGYLGPMLYLTVFGSVVAFGCYMLLIGRIGADYAAYVMLVMPVVALIISTFFESYQWTVSAVFGVMVVLSGNLVILSPAKTLGKAFRKIGKK